MPLAARRASAPAAIRASADAPAALLELGELPLDPVQVQVDLPLVVAAEAHAEDDVVHLLGADRRADCSPASVASTRSRKASTSSTLYPRRSARRRKR